MKLQNINRQEPFSVPEGYFDNLTEKMKAQIEHQQVQPGKFKVFSSAIQFAAAFLLLVGMGYIMVLFLQTTQTKNAEIVQADTAVGKYFDEYVFSGFDDDIIDYLLEEEVSTNLLTSY